MKGVSDCVLVYIRKEMRMLKGVQGERCIEGDIEEGKVEVVVVGRSMEM